MSVEKMVEKAKQVLEKQKELNYLVIEMKEEVRSVEDHNKILQRENESLRAQLLQGNYTKPSPVKVVVEPVLVKEEKPLVIEEQHAETTKVSPVEVAQEVVRERVTPKDLKPVAQVSPKTVPHREPRKRTQTQTNLIEFFLGKNVIVKIAAILMVLAVITFGQIAYVDFLNEVGRFILILSIGLAFIGLAYFFERKKIEVYANIFYIVGLATLLANNFFGRFEYELYNDYIFMYLLLPLILAPLIYFYQKRYTFLDFALNIYYLFVMFVPIIIFREVNVDVQAFLLITLILAIGGFAVYRNYTHHMDKYDKFAVIEFVVLLVAAISAIMSSPDIVSTVKVSLAHMNVLMYQLFFVFIYYIIHFQNMAKRNELVRITILLTTSVAFFIIGSSLSGTFNVLIGKDNSSLATLFTVILFVPIYVYMFKSKQDKRLTNLYLVILSGTALIFTFFVQKESPGFAGNTIYKSLDGYIKNIILLSEVLVLYLFSRITKDKTQKYLSYGFMGVALFYSLIYFVSEGLQFIEFKFFVSSIIAGIAVYVLSLYVNPTHKEKEEQDVVKLFGLAVFIPFILIFTKELILDDAPVIISALVFYLVGVRYLFNLKVFKSNHQAIFTFGLNIAIVFFVFISNLFFFDHDFSQFMDILKLFIVGLGNIYLIQALREIGFHVDKKSNNSEKLFLIFYILGVVIQAVFITQFINFEFDKVILSSYYMIIAAVGILFGFRSNWFNVRKIGLFAIYFSLAKFFIYDFWTNDFSMYVRFISYFILACVLFGIAALYSYLEKTYGTEEEALTEMDQEETTEIE